MMEVFHYKLCSESCMVAMTESDTRPVWGQFKIVEHAFCGGRFHRLSFRLVERIFSSIPYKGEKCLISHIPLVRRLNYACGICCWLGVFSHWQMRNFLKMSGTVATKGMFLSYWTGLLKWHSREGPLKLSSLMFLSLVNSSEYFSPFCSPRPVSVRGYPSAPFLSKCDRRLQRQRGAISVVMLRIHQRVQEGFVVFYKDWSSKGVEVSGNTVRIGGWGWNDMRSREQSRRIPRDLPQTDRVGVLWQPRMPPGRLARLPRWYWLQLPPMRGGVFPQFASGVLTGGSCRLVNGWPIVRCGRRCSIYRI